MALSALLSMCQSARENLKEEEQAALMGALGQIAVHLSATQVQDVNFSCICLTSLDVMREI